jgi:hypothetical protein
VIQSDAIRVPGVDPELGRTWRPAALAVARPRAIGRAIWLKPARSQPLAEQRDHRGHLELPIVDGYLARTLQLGSRRGESQASKLKADASQTGHTFVDATAYTAL